MSDQEETSFGFSKPSTTRDKLLAIKPSVLPPLPGNMQQLDQIADEAGFVSREVASYDRIPPQRVSPLPAVEPRVPLNMRIPVPLGNAFKRFCEENRYSYPEAIEEIMQRAGIPTR